MRIRIKNTDFSVKVEDRKINPILIFLSWFEDRKIRNNVDFSVLVQDRKINIISDFSVQA